MQLIAAGRLRRLIASGLSIDDSAADGWRGARKLKELDLSGTRIADRTIRIISELPAIERLTLNATALREGLADVKGLKSGAVVRVAGVEVGKVTKVELAGTGVDVHLSIKKENQTRVTSESFASIGAMSLLGEPLIDVSPSTTGTPLKDGDQIKSKKPASQLSDVAETANEGIVEATALLKDLRAGKGSLGKLFTEDKLYRELNAFVDSANAVTASINKGRGTLGKLTTDSRA